MHPKEYRKTKNITGHFTNLSLSNSKIYVGIDFTTNNEINGIIGDNGNNCFVLYPGDESIVLNNTSIKEDNKQNIIFIIDGTWPCAKKILKVSRNLAKLPKVSFLTDKVSGFKIKTQPMKLCLSTMESTLCVLELLNKQGLESIPNKKLDSFLEPFKKMVEYQYDIVCDVIGDRAKEKKAYRS